MASRQRPVTRPAVGRPDDPPLLVYGRQPVAEALKSAASVRAVWIADEAHPTPVLDAIVEAARQRDVPLLGSSIAELDERCMGGHHQGVAAELRLPEPPPLDEVVAQAFAKEKAPLLVAVDQLEDPQNFGALVRSAEAAGVDAILLPERRTVGVTSTVIRASAGAALHMPIVPVGNLTRALEQLKRAGIWSVGLDAQGKQRYDQADLTVPLVIVAGAEGRGLSRLVSEHCDLLLRLPMAGTVGSLNAATAGAIVLFEAVRQRGATPSG